VNYLSEVYSEERRPYTSYPGKLCKHIAENYLKPDYETLLDVGCGRGEHLRGFEELGYREKGIDLSEEAKELLADLEIAIVDIENEPLPYEDGSFDVVFSKSLIEHLHNSEGFIREAYRVLKPGGRLITMTPDWESVYKIFYEDYTHRTPFTRGSLYDIHRVIGFKEIQVMKFKQLPVLWKYPWLNFFSKIMSCFPESTGKFVKFSRRIMLLSWAEK